jgi:hypothetical protein
MFVVELLLILLFKAMGCIDLSRITREKWPHAEVNYMAFLVFNTYEGESYVLDERVYLISTIL